MSIKRVGLVVVDVVDLEGGHNGLGLEGHVLLVIGEAVLLGAVYQLQIVLVADALIQQVHVPLDQDGGGGFPQLGLHLFLQSAAGRQCSQGTQGQHCGGDALDMLHGGAPFLSLDNSFIPYRGEQRKKRMKFSKSHRRTAGKWGKSPRGALEGVLRMGRGRGCLPLHTVEIIERARQSPALQACVPDTLTRESALSTTLHYFILHLAVLHATITMILFSGGFNNGNYLMDCVCRSNSVADIWFDTNQSSWR